MALTTTQQSSSMPTEGGDTPGQAQAAAAVAQTSRYRPNIRPPGPIRIDGDDKRVVWELHKQLWENYTIASRLEQEEARIQRAEFLTSLGPDTLRIVNGLGLGAEDTVAQIVTKLDDFCIGKNNEAVAHFVFNNRDQGKEESVDTWIADLRVMQKSASYTHTTMSADEVALRNRIICGIHDKEAQEKMLDEGNPSLQRVIDIAKASEATKLHLKTMKSSGEVNKIVTRSTRPKKHRHTDKPKERSRKERHHSHQTDKHNTDRHYPDYRPETKRCMFCSLTHIMRKEDCPAYGRRCEECRGRNHFAHSRACPRSSRTSKPRRVHAIDDPDDSSVDSHAYSSYSGSEDSSEEVMALSSDKPGKGVYCEMRLHHRPIRFQIDCGASVNVLPRACLNRDIRMNPSTIQLRMWNKTMVKPLGEATIKLKNPKTSQKHKVNFIIVKENFTPIICKESAEDMHLITVNYGNFRNVNNVTTLHSTEQNDTDPFDGTLGCFPGTVHLKVDNTITPVVCPPRRIPVAIKKKVEDKLQQMTRRGIIEKADDPSEWVSQMAVATKKNGDLRICIDPRPLNKALKREHHPMPVLDDLLPELAKAKIFSRLDLQDGYWHCDLTEESSRLTTFQTPFGRYRWKRLPFGLSVSAEIFQKRLKSALEGLRGVECVADDILVWGSGDTAAEAESNHDENLHNLLERAQHKGLKFNKKKCQFKTTTTEFQGHILTTQGLQADPKKVRAILDMKAPSNVAEVRILRGAIGYLSRYLPSLSTVIEPISRLTKEDVPWHWETTQERAFRDVKGLITKTPVLAYYNPTKALTLQCDASQTGLGAAILQDTQPVAYASRALTDTETRYAQIEKEALAVAWGLEHFRQYTYGRKTFVITDHKPLEAIIEKPLYKAPRRLQGILMKISEYDIDLSWQPGKTMLLADWLSRTTTGTPRGDITIEQVNMISYIPVRPERLRQYQTATDADEGLQILRHVIQTGWPQDRAMCPTIVTPYFSIRDELSIQDGLIFRGERLIVPQSMRSEVKRLLHSAHLGAEACLRRARELVFWPGMSAEIKEMVATCDTCRTYEIRQAKEPLIPYDVPSRPWIRVGIDLFTYEDKEYLITVDYFSDFWEVDALTRTSTSVIIKKLKAHFARQGIPEQVVTDNAANLTSQEFRHFASEWDFEHITISPYHSQSNGKVEGAVKLAKRWLKKSEKSGTDPMLALLELRNTPSQGIDASPMQRLCQRRARTLLPTASRLLRPQTTKGIQQKLRARKDRQKQYADRGSRKLTRLREGAVVRMRPMKGDRWEKATVVKELRNRSYEVSTGRATYVRNRVDLKRSKETPPGNEPGWRRLTTHQEQVQLPIYHQRHANNAGENAAKHDRTQDANRLVIPQEPTQDPGGTPQRTIHDKPSTQRQEPKTQTPLGPPNQDNQSPTVQTTGNLRPRSGRISKAPKYLEDFVMK